MPTRRGRASGRRRQADSVAAAAGQRQYASLFNGTIQSAERRRVQLPGRTSTSRCTSTAPAQGAATSRSPTRRPMTPWRATPNVTDQAAVQGQAGSGSGREPGPGGGGRQRPRRQSLAGAVVYNGQYNIYAPGCRAEPRRRQWLGHAVQQRPPTAPRRRTSMPRARASSRHRRPVADPAASSRPVW